MFDMKFNFRPTTTLLTTDNSPLAKELYVEQWLSKAPNISSNKWIDCMHQHSQFKSRLSES
jgi:hypothetical protein